jgi:flavodoxin
MKTLVVYESKYGNTELIARALADKLGEAVPAELAAVNGHTPSIEGIDLLVVGGPTQYHGISPALRKFLDGIPTGALVGVLAAAFDTRLHGMKLLTGSAAGQIGKALERKGASLVAEPESFLVTSGEGPLEEGELKRAGTWADLIAEVGGLLAPELDGAARQAPTSGS